MGFSFGFGDGLAARHREFDKELESVQLKSVTL
jgi:hypothetical protein